MRYVPYLHSSQTRLYLRALFAGRLHRVQQVPPNDGLALTRAVTEMAYELHAEPNLYPWGILRRALYGLNAPFAREQLATVRILLRKSVEWWTMTRGFGGELWSVELGM